MKTARKGKGMERAIVRAAMRDYHRMRKLGYDRRLYGNRTAPQRLWDACARYNRYTRKSSR